MASITPASRYSRYTNTNTSNTSSIDSSKSDPSSSTERLYRPSSQALVKSKKNTIISATNTATSATAKNNSSNFSSMVKKLVETKTKTKTNSSSKVKTGTKLFIPVDFIAEDLKKNGVKKNSGLSGLQKKLFKGFKGKKEGEGSGERKALMEVKNTNGNARTLANVLRSERELLSANKEQEAQILELNLLLEEKNREVEKLKDLCLKQREEIKSLKSSILFPDVMNSQLQELWEKQGSELKQAKQLIPSLQKQVTSLTGQLQCLAEDLEEVKADKYSVKGCYDTDIRSPITPAYYQDEAENSLDFSSEDRSIPGSPDDMFLKDLNPCLTPYKVQTTFKEHEGYKSPDDEWLPKYNMQTGGDELDFDSCTREVSKSSDCCQCSKTTKSSVRAAHRSDENKYTFRKQAHHKLF